MLGTLGWSFPPKCSGGITLPSFRYSALQSTQTKSTLNTQNTTTNKMSHATLPQVALPSLSPWVEQRPHQNMVPPLPNARRRPQAVGLALAVVDLLPWGGEMRGIKKIERGGCLGLRWPPFYKLHTTIKLKLASAMEGELGRMRNQGGTCEGTLYCCFGCRID